MEEVETRCGDCWHFPRCEWLIQATKDREECDWIPSRFIAAALSEEGEEANPLRPVPGFAMPPVEVQEQIKAHREPQAEQEKE